MRFVLRPLAPRETDYELVWLSVSIGALALAGVWATLHLPRPICLFHQLTGFPCPTCGATRAALALLRANPGAAWRWNPLAFACYLGIAFFNVYALFVVIVRGRRLRLVQVAPPVSNILRAAVVLLVLMNWTYMMSANRPS